MNEENKKITKKQLEELFIKSYLKISYYKIDNINYENGINIIPITILFTIPEFYKMQHFNNGNIVKSLDVINEIKDIIKTYYKFGLLYDYYKDENDDYEIDIEYESQFLSDIDNDIDNLKFKCKILKNELWTDDDGTRQIQNQMKELKESEYTEV